MRVNLFLLFVICIFTSVTCIGDMLGTGRWIVDNVMQCDDADQYRIMTDLGRRRLNRTHDCFSLQVSFDKDIDLSYGIDVEIFKKVDGGYKFYYKYVDDSACQVIKKYAQENMERALSSAGIDPPDCPIPAGEYIVKDFVFNYEELKEKNVYGSYEVYLYLVYETERVACFRLYITYDKDESDDDYDDE